MPAPIISIQGLSGSLKKIKGCAVSLQNNEVRVFSDKNLILTIPTPVTLKYKSNLIFK